MNQNDVKALMENAKVKREANAKRFKELDDDLCQLCGAHGSDKRSLYLDCFYDIQEVVPEAIDLHGVENLRERGYYLRICKSCRGRFLFHLGQWRSECLYMRNVPKDHDGDPEVDRSGMYPVRVNGTIEWRKL